jgi:DNA-binding NtrC family response regulator
LQPIKDSPSLELFTTRHVAVVEGDADAAEMLHMFFRLMELECSVIPPNSDAIATVRRLRPDVLILDLDLPDLRALEIAREIGSATPVIFVSDGDALDVRVDLPVLRKPRGRFEELLTLFEMVLLLEE